MVGMRTELDLKTWLRALAGDRLVCLEAARGGTVGAADTFLSLPWVAGLWLPLELKAPKLGWRRRVARPAQVGWHQRAERANASTAFIVLPELEACNALFFTAHQFLDLNFSDPTRFDSLLGLDQIISNEICGLDVVRS